jgi:hypothetical protein
VTRLDFPGRRMQIVLFGTSWVLSGYLGPDFGVGNACGCWLSHEAGTDWVLRPAGNWWACRVRQGARCAPVAHLSCPQSALGGS